MDPTRFKQRRLSQAQRSGLSGLTEGVSPSAALRTAKSVPATQPASLKQLESLQPLPPKRPTRSAKKSVPRTPQPPIDMGLPGDHSPIKAPQAKVPERRSRIIKRWALRGVIVIVVLGLLGSLTTIGMSAWRVKRSFNGGAAHAAALTNNVSPSLLKGEGDGRINILLLGRGGGTHDAPDLTDTLMLASIDPINKKVVLLSIPRDLWVNVTGHGQMKINAVWETGEFTYLHKVAPGSTNQNAIAAGFALTDDVIKQVLGVQVHYNVLVDFQAFKQAVDTIGGVTVDVPEDLVDPTMAWENYNNSVLAKKGVQNFDGLHALIYVRSRETTSDFARSQRQRSVLLAMKEKIINLGTLSNPIKISGLLNSFGDNVKTDLSLGDASRLYDLTKTIANDNIKSVGLADAPNHYITTGNMNGQSIDQPVAGLFDYSGIQAFLRTQLPDGYLLKENAKILVLNGTAQPGVASAKADILKSYGYNVIGAASAPTDGWSQTTVVDLTKGKDKYTANYLQKRYNAPVVTKLPDTSIQTNGADFVIIIGTDEASTQN